MIATFAEFPVRLAGVVVATLESIRSGVPSRPADDALPLPIIASTTTGAASESSDQMEHDLNDVSYISGGQFTVESTDGSFDGTTDGTADGTADGTTDGTTA